MVQIMRAPNFHSPLSIFEWQRWSNWPWQRSEITRSKTDEIVAACINRKTEEKARETVTSEFAQNAAIKNTQIWMATKNIGGGGGKPHVA